MAARLDTPVLGVQDNYEGPNRWQVGMSYRYQYSHRHFVGPEEQHERAEDRSQVKNTIHLAEVGIRYNANPQWSFSLNVPYFTAERSSPLRQNGVVVDRALTEADGLGDAILSARRLLWKPLEHPDGNISMGLGVKIPTGDYDDYDDRERIVNGQRVFSDESVDQSIQPGDGGWGILMELQYFQRIGRSNGAVYASTTYLANPRGTNCVPTFRNNVGEEIMSVSDQYLARAGAKLCRQELEGIRREPGAPARRRPGRGPDRRQRRLPPAGLRHLGRAGVSYTNGPYTFALSVPYALYRNRTRSVADRAVPGRHGDAAFADYVILFSWGR